MLRLVYLGYVLLALALSALTANFAPQFPGEVSARIAPLFGLGHRAAQNLRAAATTLLDRRNLRHENRLLAEEVAWLKESNLELKVELERLRRALAVREAQAPGVVAIAPVITEDTSGLYRRLILGLGEADGLSVGMPVTSPDGLVGVIIETTPHRAVVRTIVDPESRVGVRPEGSPGRGIAMESLSHAYIELLLRRKVDDRLPYWFLYGACAFLAEEGWILKGQVDVIHQDLNIDQATMERDVELFKHLKLHGKASDVPGATEAEREASRIAFWRAHELVGAIIAGESLAKFKQLISEMEADPSLDFERAVKAVYGKSRDQLVAEYEPHFESKG